MDIECPNCEESFDVEPGIDCGSENIEDKCPDCEKEFLYNVYYWPVPENVREMPECRMKNHVYGEKEDRGHYFKSKCMYCGKKKRDYKDSIEG